MKKLIACAAAAALALGAGALAPQSAAALTADQATRAYTAFLDHYWDPDAQYFFTYSDHEIHVEHAVGPQDGRYTDYWWEAQLWGMVMDRYQATGDPDARAKIDQVYDGFRAAYPDFSANDYNDDIGWWAAGAVRAYELTGEHRFLDASKDFYGYIAQFEDTTYGGGLWWKNVDVGDGTLNEKNVATNGTAIQTALRLYHATGDTNYRAQAVRLYDWLRTDFDRDGHLRDNVSHDGEFKDYDFTYNQGQFAGAALQMYLVTHDRAYLHDATRAVDWAVDNLTVSGTFRDEGSADGAAFKAVLTRVMRELIDDAGQTQYQQVLTLNATQAANHVDAAGLGGTDLSAPAPDGPLQSIVAGASAAIQQQARPDGSAAAVEGTRDYQAENVPAVHIASTTEVAGYTGRGAMIWPAEAGSSATVPVNAARSGDRTVHVRYQASEGEAVRMASIGDAAAVPIMFPATPTGEWAELTTTLPLATGWNSVTIAVDGGGTGRVVIDRMTLDP